MYLVELWQSRALRGALMAGLLAGLGAYLLLVNLIGQTRVIITNRNIPQGEVIKEEWLTEQLLPRHAVVPGAISSRDAAVGKVLAVARFSGDQISNASLGARQRTAPDSIPAGFVMMPITVRDYRSVERYVKQGSVIGLIPVSTSALTKQETTSRLMRGIKVADVALNKGANGRETDAQILVVVPLETAQKLAELEQLNFFKIIIGEGT